eukprot:scaffold902_cov254-Ochromonas_danica.AAC.2
MSGVHSVWVVPSFDSTLTRSAIRIFTLDITKGDLVTNRFKINFNLEGDTKWIVLLQPALETHVLQA